MKKKAVVALCSLMAVLSLAACGKETSSEKEWAGVYIGKDGSVLILCEDGGGYKWTRRESNPCPKARPLSFYYHSKLFRVAPFSSSDHQFTNNLNR